MAESTEEQEGFDKVISGHICMLTYCRGGYMFVDLYWGGLCVC